MRINDVIVEDQTDEGIASAIGRGVGATAQGIGAVAGGAAGAWDRMKQGFAKGKAAVANPDGAATDATSTATGSTVQGGAPVGGSTPATGNGIGTNPQPSATTPAAPVGTNPQPSATTPAAPAPASAPSSDLDQIKASIARLNPQQKSDLAKELAKSTSAPAAAPAAQPAQDVSARLSQMRAGQTAQNQANSALRQQQVAQTTAANAQSAQADAALIAAVKAAKAKPGFQQTAQDKLTIKQGAEKGIHESKKKKKKSVAEFKSNFLGRMI